MTVTDWQADAQKTLENHPWENQHSTVILNDLRGEPAEPNPPCTHF